jgi:hypothetical protein
MSRKDEGQVTTQLLQLTVRCREHSPAEAAAMRRKKPHERAAADIHSEILNTWQIPAACSSADRATESIVVQTVLIHPTEQQQQH